MKNLIANGLADLKIDASQNQVDTIMRYVEEIRLWNPHLGLVAEGEDLVGRHVLDSLAGFDAIGQLRPGRLADVGSGAGFPGIPLSIFLNDTQIVLIERSGKRAGFLRNIILTLKLKTVSVLEVSVEPGSLLEDHFDVVTFRAFSPLDDILLGSLIPLLIPGGTIAAYKGRRKTLETEMGKVTLPMESVEIRSLDVPGINEERHLVLMKPRSYL